MIPLKGTPVPTIFPLPAVKTTHDVDDTLEPLAFDAISFPVETIEIESLSDISTTSDDMEDKDLEDFLIDAFRVDHETPLVDVDPIGLQCLVGV